MIVTLTILSILSLAALPLSEAVVQHTKESELSRALSDVRTALDAYKEARDTGRIAPATATGYPPTMHTLVDGVPDQKRPGMFVYFLRAIPRDPFCPAETATDDCWNVRAYDSPPTSPHAGADVFDIKSKSDRIGSDGRPYHDW